MSDSMDRIIYSALLLIVTVIYAAIEKASSHLSEDITIGYVIFILGFWAFIHIYTKSHSDG